MKPVGCQIVYIRSKFTHTSFYFSNIIITAMDHFIHILCTAYFPYLSCRSYFLLLSTETSTEAGFVSVVAMLKSAVKKFSEVRISVNILNTNVNNNRLIKLLVFNLLNIRISKY